MPGARTSSPLLAVLLFTQAVQVQTQPTLSFPINSQVPPVARIGGLLSFTFSSSTFATSLSSPGADSTLVYTLANNPPSWLFLDSANRRLYGTPQENEVAPGTVVGVDFTLVATDSTGSSASDNVTLVVSRNAAPTVQIPLGKQIQSFGNYSEPSSILYHPNTAFRLMFSQDTFAHPSTPKLTYYAISSFDDSPLPSWISFEADSLTFVGTTPPFSSLIEPPQIFSFKLIASDIVGFSAVWVEFSIVVGSHMLSAIESSVALNATIGTLLTYDGLVGNIELDGQPASAGEVNATAENLPSWLSFDRSSWNIIGTTPATANSTSFNILFNDVYSDTLNVTFDVQVVGNNSIFSRKFPTLSVEPGKHISFDLASYLLDLTNIDVTTDIEPATSWLSWDASSLTLSGDVPDEATKSVIRVEFTVSTVFDNIGRRSKTRKRAGSGQSQILTIQIDPIISTTSTQSATSTVTSSTLSATTSAASSGGGSGPGIRVSKWVIIAIVLSVVVALAIIIGVCLYCCRRRKKKRESRSSLGNNDGPSTVRQEYQGTPVVKYLPGFGAPLESPYTEKRAKTSTTPATNRESQTLPNEKRKSNKLRKSSLIRAEVGRPASQALAPAASATVATAHDEADRSEVSTPGSKLKDWFASVRSFRVVHMRRPNANPRFSDSNMTDDSVDVSHHDLDLDMGIGFTRSNVLSSLRSSSRDSSFRSNVEVGVPTFAAADRNGGAQYSRQDTPPGMSPNDNFNKNTGSSAGLQLNKGKKREATPLIPRPLGPTPEGARNRHAWESEARQDGSRDPFTDSPILGLMTPDIILTSPASDNSDAGPFALGLRQTTSENANFQQLLEHSHPYSSYPVHSSPPQRRAVSSSFFHTTRGPYHHRRNVSSRPVRSQIAFAIGEARPRSTSLDNSVSSVDSMRSRTRRFARKASSHAKGAVSLASMALGQPKRRTLAALRKNPHLSLRSSKRSIRAIFENTDAPSAAGGEDDEGEVGDIYSPGAASASTRHKRKRMGQSSSRRGISGLLNPRIWPQPTRVMTDPTGSAKAASGGMPWQNTPEVPQGVGGDGDGRRASTSSAAAPRTSSNYNNPYRWKPVGGKNSSRKTSSSRSRSRHGTPRSNNSSSHGSVWSQYGGRRRRPRASTSRSKLSSSAGGSASGRLNGQSFRSFRMQQPQLPIRRRPVGAPERTTPQSTYSTTIGPGGGAASITTAGGGGFPSPIPSLPSPIRENNGGAGLGISTYEDIISSSPFHPSRSRRSSWTTISGSARGGGQANNDDSNNNNPNSSSSGDALDSSTGTLPNWIVFGRAEDLNLNAFTTGQQVHDAVGREDFEDEEGEDPWFGLGADGNRLPNRESPVIRSPIDWRRFGPPSSTPSPSVERGRGGGGGHARRSMFIGGPGGGFGGGTGGGGGGALRIVNPGNSIPTNTTTTASATSGSGSGIGSVRASTTAQSNRVSEGATSSGRRVFL